MTCPTCPILSRSTSTPGDPSHGWTCGLCRQGGAASLTEEFCAALEARLDDHDLIHTHYWLSGLVGAQLKARHGIPLVHTMHTMARVKNSSLGEDQLVEPHVREHGESAIVRAADVLTASTSDEAAELQVSTAPRPSRS